MNPNIHEHIVLIPNLTLEFTKESRNDFDSFVAPTESPISSLSTDTSSTNYNEKITTNSNTESKKTPILKTTLKTTRRVNYEIKLKKNKKKDKKNLIKRCSIM